MSELNIIESKLTQLMKNSSYAWWEWNIKENIVSSNDLKITMLGYHTNEFKNVGYEAFTNLLHPEDYQKTMDAMTEYLNGGSDLYQIDYRIKKKNGEYIWYMDRGFAIKRKFGRPEIMRGIVLDLGASLLDNKSLYERIKIFSFREKLRKLISLCCVCKKIKMSDDEWIDADINFEDFMVLKVTHGICPKCIVKMYKNDLTEEQLQSII